MIYSAPYNAIDFSAAISRESQFFSNKLQRRKGIFSPCSAYFSFYYTPATMPSTPPTATIYFKSAESTSSKTHSAVVELTNAYVYLFLMSNLTPSSSYLANVKIGGTDEVIYCEEFECVAAADLKSRNIATIIAYNNDYTNGFLTSDYPACGFFEYSELDSDQFASEETVYNYPGKKILLDSVNYIKKKYIFVNLSMYRRNLLKYLCKTNNLTIDGKSCTCATEFKDEKDNNTEVGNVEVEFIFEDNNGFLESSTSYISKIQPTNIFM